MLRVLHLRDVFLLPTQIPFISILQRFISLSKPLTVSPLISFAMLGSLLLGTLSSILSPLRPESYHSSVSPIQKYPLTVSKFVILNWLLLIHARRHML